MESDEAHRLLEWGVTFVPCVPASQFGETLTPRSPGKKGSRKLTCYRNETSTEAHPVTRERLEERNSRSPAARCPTDCRTARGASWKSGKARPRFATSGPFESAMPAGTPALPVAFRAANDRPRLRGAFTSLSAMPARTPALPVVVIRGSSCCFAARCRRGRQRSPMAEPRFSPSGPVDEMAKGPGGEKRGSAAEVDRIHAQRQPVFRRIRTTVIGARRR